MRYPKSEVVEVIRTSFLDGQRRTLTTYSDKTGNPLSLDGRLEEMNQLARQLEDQATDIGRELSGTVPPPDYSDTRYRLMNSLRDIAGQIERICY